MDGVGTDYFSAPNEAPRVNRSIPDQTAGANRSFYFALAADTFVDQDAGQTLSYAATKNDGTALPRWLSFDTRTLTFSGRPLVPDVGQVRVRITATDSAAPPLAAWTEFTMTVTINEETDYPWHNSTWPLNVNDDDYISPLDALFVINELNAHR